MKQFIVSLAAVLFFAGALFARAKDSGEACRGVSQKVAALAEQYRELRSRRKSLPAGEYDRDLSDAGGKLSKVLSSLGAELGRPPYTKRIIVRCLGAPDAVRNDRQMGPLLGVYQRDRAKAGRKLEPKHGRQYLIYFWRGWHDFVFFISEGGKIVDHGWWFAYE
jgi:hypothetical protein